MCVLLLLSLDGGLLTIYSSGRGPGFRLLSQNFSGSPRRIRVSRLQVVGFVLPHVSSYCPPQGHAVTAMLKLRSVCFSHYHNYQAACDQRFECSSQCTLLAALMRLVEFWIRITSMGMRTAVEFKLEFPSSVFVYVFVFTVCRVSLLSVSTKKNLPT